MNTSSFYSTIQQSVSGAVMLPTEMEKILKRMKELENQNGELYREQSLRQFDEPITAKYLNELLKEHKQQNKSVIDLLGFLRAGDGEQNVAVELCRERLGVGQKRLEKLTFVENEEAVKVADETIQLLLDYLMSWSHGIIRGCESDYQKRHAEQVDKIIQALRLIQTPPDKRAGTVRGSRTDLRAAQAASTPIPTEMNQRVHEWMNLSHQASPRIHRQGTPINVVSPAPSRNLRDFASEEKIEALMRENKELQTFVDKMEEDFQSLKMELYAVKENKSYIDQNLQAAMRDCSHSYEKLERLESDCSVTADKHKVELEQKDTEILALKKTNSELQINQELLQQSLNNLQVEMASSLQLLGSHESLQDSLNNLQVELETKNQEFEQMEAEVLDLKKKNSELLESFNNLQVEMAASVQLLDSQKLLQESFVKLQSEANELKIQASQYEQKDAEVLSLKKKNSEILSNQEMLQRKHESLLEEIKALQTHNDYLMANIGVVEERNARLDAELYNLEELEQSYADSKKAIVELKNELARTKELLKQREKDIEKYKKAIAETTRSTSTNPFLNMKNEPGPVKGYFLEQLIAEQKKLEEKLMEKSLNVEQLLQINRELRNSNYRRIMNSK